MDVTYAVDIIYSLICIVIIAKVMWYEAIHYKRIEAREIPQPYLRLRLSFFYQVLHRSIVYLTNVP